MTRRRTYKKQPDQFKMIIDKGGRILDWAGGIEKPNIPYKSRFKIEMKSTIIEQYNDSKKQFNLIYKNLEELEIDLDDNVHYISNLLYQFLLTNNEYQWLMRLVWDLRIKSILTNFDYTTIRELIKRSSLNHIKVWNSSYQEHVKEGKLELSNYEEHPMFKTFFGMEYPKEEQ